MSLEKEMFNDPALKSGQNVILMKLSKNAKTFKIQVDRMFSFLLIHKRDYLTTFRGGMFSGIDNIRLSFQTGFRLFLMTRVFTD